MIQKIKRIIRSGVVRNAGWIVAGKIVQMLINLIVGLLTARYLGPSNFGLIGYANAYTTFFTCICTLGINSIIVKEFFDHPGEEGKVLGTSLGLRVVSSLFSVFMIIGISSFMDADEPETKLVVALCSISLIFNIFELLNYWFQSRLQSKKTAIAALIAYTVTAIYKVILLFMGKPVTYFALATSVDYLCVAAILLFFYIKEGGGKFLFSWKYGKSLLKKSHHYILSGMMIAVYAQTDKIMLKHMVDEAAIGYYTTALSLSTVWCFLLSAIITSMVPVIMQAHKENKKQFYVLNISMYQIVFYLSAIVSMGFLLLGDWVVELLYGAAYLPAVHPLKIITWQTAFSYLGVARDTWVVCENKQKYLKYIYVSAALANVVMNFLLIPIWGTIGAALASLTAQIVTVMVAPFFIKEMRENAMMMLDAILLRGLREKRTEPEGNGSSASV